jgi:S1-C subfamily serine protease
MRSVAQGIKIASVKQNTSASHCGLKRNDIIVEFDGESVPGVSDFELQIMECQIGQQYPIKVMRQDQEITLNLTIDEMPLELVGRSVNTESVSWKTLGLSVQMLENDNHQRYAYLNEQDRGIIVEKVRRNSPGATAKIPRGALIIAINGQEMMDVQSLKAFLENNSNLSEFILDIKSFQGTEKASLIK